MFKEFHKKYGCIFIHIPKVAGTSIERVVFESSKWLVGHKKAIDYIKKDKDKFESLFSFAFVRNPFDRTVSAFHYLKGRSCTLGDKRWADIHLKDYENFNDFALALENKTVRDKILSWMHFVPQYRFVCDENRSILVNFIGKFENIEKDFEVVKKQLKINRDLVHANSSSHESYKKYYNEQTYQIISEIYRNDFELFDYDLEYANLFNQSLNDLQKNKINDKKLEIRAMRLRNYKKKHSFFMLKCENESLKNENDLYLNKAHSLETELIQTKNQLDSQIKILESNQNQSNLKIQRLTEANQQLDLKNQQLTQTNSQLNLKTKELDFTLHYGTAKDRIHNHLSYKLGQAMIENSKSLLGYIRMPYVLSYIKDKHKQEQQQYQEAIKKNPNLKLPNLESYPDYKESLKEKECFTYKLGEAFIKANTAGGGGHNYSNYPLLTSTLQKKCVS
ncbi:sulfotransferase family 2 domain-containing protein [Helicobacter canadensis]|uniref:sulfotransferase family 2 domain-containing protein n=1 Tax=Helicobacter canadensis TaxID=123841 RepID=UPI0018F7FE8D|nr:sulfotransferase family 2 domain-containing protein [Helicobacter canadensis]